jgi:DNA mismatch repair protein MutS2
LEKAREEAELEIAEVRRRLRAAEDLIREPNPDREKLRQALAQVKEAQRHLEEKEPQIKGRGRKDLQDVEYALDRNFRVGDYVLVRSLNQHGDIVALWPGQSEAEVSLGNFKVRVRTRELVKTRGRPKAGKNSTDVLVSLPALSNPPASEIEVRGWRVEEVLPVLDRYIDDAYLAGMTTVRIIHGKGTGVLRQVVREQLAKHPLVRSFEPASPSGGGDGVTVATLAI